jgi:type VI secretion system protein ImpH
MAAASGRSATALSSRAPGATDVDPRAWIERFANFPRGSVADLLFRESYRFSFFQAVRVLAQLAPERQPVGLAGPPATELVRFRAHNSLSFPPSALYDLTRPAAQALTPQMTVTFFGLTGPSGILPRHYTELLLRLRDLKGPERTALRDWFDLFNHRLISLFYRAWEKYRFFVAFDRREHEAAEPDAFTQALYSLVGLGTPGLRGRLRVSQWDVRLDVPRERVLARIHDLGLLEFGGLLAHRPRNASGLECLLAGYFGLPVRMVPFHGQWMRLGPECQTALGGPEESTALGRTAVVGERVWDVQGKVRLRVGPMTLEQFNEFQPDRSANPERKAFFLLLHLARLYIGPELSFDVQFILRAAEVPESSLSFDEDAGPRLGRNAWLTSRAPDDDVADAVFEGEEIYWVNESKRWATRTGSDPWHP